MPQLVKKREFKSPYDQFKHLNGQKFTIIRTLTDEENKDKIEVGEIYKIRFETGEEIEAWPEEIFDNA